MIIDGCIFKDGWIPDISNIYFNYANINFTNTNVDDIIISKKGYLIISDTNNHCIRIMNFSTNKINTVAGTCGTAGFLDGYWYNSLLNTPKSIGIDRFNRIFINDSENHVIRWLYIPNSFFSSNDITTIKLFTLTQGSCYDLVNNYQDNYPSKIALKSYMYSICNVSTLTGDYDSNYFNFTSIDSYCFNNYSNC